MGDVGRHRCRTPFGGPLGSRSTFRAARQHLPAAVLLAMQSGAVQVEGADPGEVAALRVLATTAMARSSWTEPWGRSIWAIRDGDGRPCRRAAAASEIVNNVGGKNTRVSFQNERDAAWASPFDTQLELLRVALDVQMQSTILAGWWLDDPELDDLVPHLDDGCLDIVLVPVPHGHARWDLEFRIWRTSWHSMTELVSGLDPTLVAPVDVHPWVVLSPPADPSTRIHAAPGDATGTSDG